jgi:HEAT repeat protein
MEAAVTPIKAGRKFVAGAARALVHRPLVLLTGVILAGLATLSLLRFNSTPRFPYPLALTVTDPSMTMIGTMVERDDLWGATAMVGSSYRFDSSTGLLALRRFSVLVLRRGLKEHDPYERCYAISALASAGDQSQIAALVGIFLRTRSADLKMAAADGLGDIGNADAVEALGQLYSRTELSYRRIVLDGVAAAHDPGAIELLSRALTASDQAMRVTAARGMGQLGNRGAIGILRRYAAVAQDNYERAMAAYSLLRLGDSSAEEIAEAILRGRVDDNARAVAALALGHAHDPRVVALLRAAIGDHNIDVQIGAAVALTHYADPGGTEYLMAAMRDEDSMTRLHVGQLLNEIQFHNAHEVVMAAAASADPELYLRGIRAIGLSGSDRDVDFLARLADAADDPMARAEVAWALGRIGSVRSVGPLMAMVSEPDRTVRYTAADALDRAAIRLLEDRPAGGA